MEYSVLVFLHIGLGILWAGGAVVLGLFIIPAVLDAGPAGGAVMAGVTRRKLAPVMVAFGVIVVLTGLRLYMLRFSAGWLTSPAGIVISLGALLGIGGLGIGMFVQKPLVERIGKAAAGLAASGAPPTPEQAAEMHAMRGRLRSIARLTALHLLGAALLMSLHRVAAGF